MPRSRAAWRLFAARSRVGARSDVAVFAGIRAVLLAPDFLFRVEVDKQQETPWMLSGPELAVRLSYYLWGTMPDEKLTRLGATGALHKDEVLRAEGSTDVG